MLREKVKFAGPITEQSKAILKQFRTSSDTHLKTALFDTQPKVVLLKFYSANYLSSDVQSRTQITFNNRAQAYDNKVVPPAVSRDFRTFRNFRSSFSTAVCPLAVAICVKKKDTQILNLSKKKNQKHERGFIERILREVYQKVP